MTPERMYELAAALGEAKNRRCVEDALAFMHSEITLTSTAWGTVAKGKAANATVLHHFFASYPDYSVSIEGYAADNETFVGWGTVRMTMAPSSRDARNLTPNGKRVQVPVHIRMTFEDDLILTEHFACDLAQIAAQSGVSIDAVYANILGPNDSSVGMAQGALQ